jgi:hypothetical protein
MAGEFFNCLDNLAAVPLFLGIGVAYSRSLRYDNYVRMQNFVRRTTYLLFGPFGGVCGVLVFRRISI